MNLAPNSFIGCLRHGWDLTPWDCIEAQLHELRLWIGWPCNGCERPVTIELPKAAEKYDRNYDKPRRTWPEGMSKAVARRLGLV